MENTLFSDEIQEQSQDFDQVLHALKNLRVHVAKEEHFIHEAIKKTLTKHNVNFIHEKLLGPRNRVDFLTIGGTAIEVKKGRPNKTALLKQISRYLDFEQVETIIVVVEKWMDFPEEINGKKVCLISLNRLWGMTS